MKKSNSVSAGTFANPMGFVTTLGYRLWSKQAEIIQAVHDNRRVAVRSCNGSGKTFTAACAVVWWLMSFEEGAIAITTAPTERQVSELLWREIRRIHRKNERVIGGEAHKTALEITPERYARGFSTDSPERFQGFHNENILFVVDEASGVGEEIYEAIEGSMTTGKARVLLIGNPTRREGTFYEAFHSKRGLWHTVHISAFDTPNFSLKPGESGVPGLATPEWADEQARNWGKGHAQYQIRVLGEFPTQAQDALVSLKDVEAAVERGRTPVEAETDAGEVKPASSEVTPYVDKRYVMWSEAQDAQMMRGPGWHGIRPGTPFADLPVLVREKLRLAREERAKERAERMGTGISQMTQIPGRGEGRGPHDVILSAAKNPVPPLPGVPLGRERAGVRVEPARPEPGSPEPAERVEGPRVPPHPERSRGIFGGAERPNIVLGVDVARFGADKTAICVREGDRVLAMECHWHEDTMQTSGRVADAIRRWRPKDVFVDETGVGGGVVDRLKELGFRNVRGVNVGSGAKKPERYANLRAELYDVVRMKLAKGELALPDDRELVGQLASIRYMFTSAGQMQIESKDSLSGRGLPSPDRVDALVLSYAASVRQPYKIWIGPEGNRQGP